jgi:hypothetical protein
MKTVRKSDSQIMQILSQIISGVPMSELCREYDMSGATFISGVLNTAAWIHQ